MPTTVYAMDTNFYNSLGSYDFDARCEILRVLGYDATYLTLWSDAAWDDVPRLGTVKERFGLDVAAVYATLDIAGHPDHEENGRIVDLVSTIEGCDLIEFSMRSSDPNLSTSDPTGDAAAGWWLRKLLDIAERRGKTLALYPHLNFWMERIEDAVRLCRAVDHPKLRMVFTGYHWYAVDGTNLSSHLTATAPYLVLANLCGSRRFDNGSGLPATIELLDEGELDNFAVLGALSDQGYNGPVGIQGYSAGGDAYTKLQRSLAAFRDMERRLREHPEWARLRPPRRG